MPPFPEDPKNPSEFPLNARFLLHLAAAQAIQGRKPPAGLARPCYGWPR